jgi:pyroglutamyl-peptidase
MAWPGIRILVTGFGPFPGVPFNASSVLVEQLAETDRRSVPRAMIFPAILPTDWRLAAAMSRTLVQEFDPDIILHFGVSRRCTGFEVETQARNLASPFLDHAGHAPLGRTVRRGAPPMLKATLPAPLLVQRLRLAGLPAVVSSDAGRYLCNAVLYETLLHIRNKRPAPLVGFIHMPALPAQTGNGAFGDAARAWRELKVGAEIIVRATIPLAMAARRRGSMHRTEKWTHFSDKSDAKTKN